MAGEGSPAECVLNICRQSQAFLQANRTCSHLELRPEAQQNLSH